MCKGGIYIREVYDFVYIRTVYLYFASKTPKLQLRKYTRVLEHVLCLACGSLYVSPHFCLKPIVVCVSNVESLGDLCVQFLLSRCTYDV